MPRSELTQRVLVAAVGIPAAVVVLYLGGWVLGLVLAAIAAIGAAEFYRLASAGGVRPFVGLGAAAAAVAIGIAVLRPTFAAAAPAVWLLLLVLFLTAAAASIWMRGLAGRPLDAAAATAAGALYTGGTLCFAVFLRHFPLASFEAGATATQAALVGTALVAFPIALTWLNDTFAYFGGRRWGRRKLIPSVSPGKTVEGAVSGVVGAVIVGALYAWLIFGAWLEVPLGPLAGVAAGALISITAQVGDLAESLMKRAAGVKDSGHLLPGHGGVLDRFDALLFTLPVAYAFLWLALPTLPA